MLGDGTGALVLRFIGRPASPGWLPERACVAEGTPALERGVLVMLNPLYSFVADEMIGSATSW